VPIAPEGCTTLRAQHGTVAVVVGDGLVVSLSAILVGLYAGLLRGGLVRNLGGIRIDWWPLLVVGVTLPVVVRHTEPSRAVPLVTLSLLALIAFTLRNRAIVGMSVVAIGLGSNLLVLVANDGMPVRADALVAAGLARADEVDRVDIAGVQRLERDGDQFVFLADVIPLPETEQVLSFGDLVILAGLADVAANLLLGRRRPAAESDRPSEPEPAPRRALPSRDDAPGAAATPGTRRPDPVDEPVHVLVGAGVGAARVLDERLALLEVAPLDLEAVLGERGRQRMPVVEVEPPARHERAPT
jgi:hypothetical protein